MAIPIIPITPPITVRDLCALLGEDVSHVRVYDENDHCYILPSLSLLTAPLAHPVALQSMLVHGVSSDNLRRVVQVLSGEPSRGEDQ